MSGRVLFGISILVVTLFLIQPVASSFVGNDDSSGSNKIVATESNDSDTGSELQAPDRIKIEKVKPSGYLEKLRENRQEMLSADPNVAVPEYDLDSMLGKEDDMVVQNMAAYLESCKPREVRFGLPGGSGSHSKTRAAAADLELSQMEWESKINTGWAHYTETTSSPGNQPGYGGFMVGETTRISVQVVNNNPATVVMGIHINFTIYDYYSGRPLIKIPTRVAFDMTTVTKTVTFDFTPPAACVLYIGAYIDYRQDTDRSNNGLGWYGMRVLTWSSDFESSGYGDGSQQPNTWTGVPGLGGNDQWHKTDSAANQNNPDHTASWSWYHGDESGSDIYDDALTLRLISPKIDMGDISDGQDELGKLRDGYYWIPYVTYWAGLYTGSAEAGDTLWAYEYTDDDSVNWKSQYAPVYGAGNISGNWGTQDGSQAPGWYSNQFPLAVFVGDGNGGQRPSSGAKNWSRIQFRLTFEGDGDSQTAGTPGFYADDLITGGCQHYLPPYSVRLRAPTPVTQSGVPILYPGIVSEFSTRVSNFGEALTNVPVKVDIKKGSNDDSTPSVSGWPKTKTISALAEDEEAEITWSWTPAEEGDYYIMIEAGDLNQEYTPANNDWELKVYVRKPNAAVLVVDDDNSMHNNGIFYVDVEWKMLVALDDLDVTYNVYSVGWNESGPSKTIMNNYAAVIWMTGLDNEHSNYGTNPDYGDDWGITFKPEDQTEVASYLEQGKRNLWVISTGVLYDLTDTNGAASPTGFLKDYLHVIYCNNNESTPSQLIGDDASLDEDGSYETEGGSVVPYFSDRGSIVEADSKSRGIYFQNIARTAYNSLEYSENYNLVLFAFNFYMIKDPEDRKVVAYRVLHFFGLLGGLDIVAVDDNDLTVSLGGSAAFRFKVTNSALMQEKVNLRLVNPAPAFLPEGWTIKLNDLSPDAATNRLTVAGSGGERYFYLNVTAPSKYLDKSGNLDDNIKNTTAGSEIQFKVRCECSKYPDHYNDFGSAKVTTGLEGDVSLTAGKSADTIELYLTDDPEEYYAEYDVTLRNRTNGMDDYKVMVSLDSPGELTASIDLYGDDVTDGTVTLPPRLDVTPQVRVQADPHDLAGEYPVTFYVKTESGDMILNETILTTTVEQFYDIRLGVVTDEVYSVKLDPNDFEDIYHEVMFRVVLENYGNGPDTITLEWDEHRDSPGVIPTSWYEDLVAIYHEDDLEEIIEEIELPAYDRSTGTPGTADLVVKLTVPQEEKKGRFWIDLRAGSGAPKSYLNKLLRDDLQVEDNLTFQLQLVMPELEIDDGEPKLYDKDGKEVDEVNDKLYTENPLTVKVKVTNSGDSPVEDVPVEFSVSLNTLPPDTQKKNVSLGPGESKEVEFTFTPGAEGTYNLRVTVNPDDDILGDSIQDNSKNKYIQVLEPEDDEKKEKEKEERANTIAYILIIIVVVIIAVLGMLFMIRRKKGKSEEDYDMDVPMTPGREVPGRMVFDDQLPPVAPAGMQPRHEMQAPAPPARRGLPPAGGAKKCPSCGEPNPAENKFCQGCGSKLA